MAHARRVGLTTFSTPFDDEAVDVTETVEQAQPTISVDVSSLVLADYDHLPASDIVALLEGLEPAERSAISGRGSCSGP